MAAIEGLRFMAMSVEALLAPVSEDNPVGEDLSYDSGRQIIEAAFETTASGSASTEGEINWRDIVGLIEQQSKQTKDLWLPIYLMRAGARMGQIEVIDTGSGYLAGLLDQYWDHVHPQLEEYGFQGRKTPLESLTRIGEFLGPLKSTILIKHPRLGSYSAADLERFSVGGDSEDGYGMFRAALAEMPVEDQQAIVAHLDAIKTGVTRADAIMTANSDGETSINFKNFYDSLAVIRKGLVSFLPKGVVESDDEEPADAPANSGSGGSPARSSAPGAVESREDVMKALDAIGDYYRRKEPTSPVPLALKRAREWVTLDFLAVLEDIAPNSIDEAKRVLMSNRNSESGY